MLREVGDEPGLADPGIAHDRDELGGPLADRAPEQLAQERALALATDERRRVVLVPQRGIRPESDRTPYPQRVGLALHRHGVELDEVSRGARREERRSADDDVPERRDPLHAGRRVDDVSRHVLPDVGSGRERDDGLSRVHRDAHRERELVGPCLDREGGPEGALGVILMGDGCAEDAHRRVADELVQDAPEALDLLLGQSMEGDECAPDVLGVGLVGVGREPCQVGEQDRDDPSLFDRAGAASGWDQCGSARWAEASIRRDRPSTRRARAARGFTFS